MVDKGSRRLEDEILDKIDRMSNCGYGKTIEISDIAPLFDLTVSEETLKKIMCGIHYAVGKSDTLEDIHQNINEYVLKGNGDKINAFQVNLAVDERNANLINAYISTFYTNRFRTQVPWFQYMYYFGIFQRDAGNIKVNNYLTVRSIAEGYSVFLGRKTEFIPFDKFMSSGSDFQIFSLYMQILYAIYIAHQNEISGLSIEDIQVMLIGENDTIPIGNKAEIITYGVVPVFTNFSKTSVRIESPTTHLERRINENFEPNIVNEYQKVKDIFIKYARRNMRNKLVENSINEFPLQPDKDFIFNDRYAFIRTRENGFTLQLPIVFANMPEKLTSIFVMMLRKRIKYLSDIRNSVKVRDKTPTFNTKQQQILDKIINRHILEIRRISPCSSFNVPKERPCDFKFVDRELTDRFLRSIQTSKCDEIKLQNMSKPPTIRKYNELANILLHKIFSRIYWNSAYPFLDTHRDNVEYSHSFWTSKIDKEISILINLLSCEPENRSGTPDEILVYYKYLDHIFGRKVRNVNVEDISQAAIAKNKYLFARDIKDVAGDVVKNPLNVKKLEMVCQGGFCNLR